MSLSLRMIKTGLVATLCLPGLLGAQTDDAQTSDAATQPLQKEQLVKTVEKTAPLTTAGKRFGDYLVTPYLQIGALYDDNIFALPFFEIDDMIAIINPALNVQSDWERHKLNIDAWASIGRYQDYDSEDYEDYGVSGDFRYDLAEKSNLFGSLGYQKAHEDRSSADEAYGLTPTFYSRTDIALGMVHNFGGLWTRFGVTRDSFDFDNVDSLRGVINNDDRDRDMDAAGMRVGYPVTETADLFVQAAYDRRIYDEEFDDNGFARDSDGSRLAGGVIYKPGKRLKLELLAGNLKQSYEDPRFSDISKPDYGVDLSWRATPASRFSVLIDRTINETTLSNASGYLNDLISARIEHQLQYNLSVNAYGALSYLDYQGIERKDDLVSAGFGIKYLFSKPFFIAFDYDFLRRDSNEDIVDYYRNQAFFSVGIDGLDKSRPALLAAGNGQSGEAFGGFYVGGQAGQASMAADYGDPRGPGVDGTFLKAGLVANAAAWRLFGGYGKTFDHLYLGAEVELESADSELEFVRGINRRDMRVSREQAGGLSARIGYVSDSNSLLFTRLGAMRSEFHTDYAFQDVSVSNDQTLTGVQVGLGVEIPLSQYLAWRMDYSWRDYPEFDVDYELATANYNIDESIFYLGLSANFSGNGLTEKEVQNSQPDRFTGLYLGGQVGHGVIFTDFAGRRGPPADGGFVSTVIGNDGFSAGGVAGFGAQFNRFYLGLEAELDAGMSQWTFDRQVDVRTITVDKRETAGAGVRVGYVLADRALLYAGGGLINTRFETRYRFRDVTEIINKRIHGTRLVLGTEVPVSDEFSWRFEYAYSDYKPFYTEEETNDEFDVNETLFRLGGIVRF